MKLFNKGWIYGSFNDKPARKNKRTQKIQIRQHAAGECGYRKDHWIDSKSKWWHRFIEDKNYEFNKKIKLHASR